MADMYVVAVVDIVIVEPDVMGIALHPILEGECVTGFDLVFEVMVVHGKPFWLVGYPSFMLTVGGFIGECGGDLS